MKKFLSLFAIAVFSFANANAETTIKIDAAGDAYFITDNARVPFFWGGSEKAGLERQFAFYNPMKGSTGINHAFLIGRAESDWWRVNVGAGYRGDAFQLHMEEANVAVKLFGDLWVEGGYFLPSLAGDVDYTFDAWFTGNSLTDFLASDYQTGMGLFYEIDPTLTVRARAINSAYSRMPENRSTTFLLNGDWEEAFGLSDWDLSFGTMFGNQSIFSDNHTVTTPLQTLTAIHLKGKITDELELNFRGKFGTLEDGAVNDKNETSMATAFSAQVMLRYALTGKMGIGCRFAYTNDEDDIFGIGNSGIDLGLVFEYRPVESVYVRLEGNILSLSNSDGEHLAKVFNIDGTMKPTRMEAALSLGYIFNLYEKTTASLE
jgi:hypothetical protein